MQDRGLYVERRSIVSLEHGSMKAKKQIFCERNKEARNMMLVQSFYEGVATGDGRHHLLHLLRKRETDLADGFAIRNASVHWTPSAPSGAGRRTPTGHEKSCPSSLGPYRVSDRSGRRARLPNSPGGHPRPPRGTRIPAGSPAPPPSRLPVATTKGFAPGPLGGSMFCPGPRLRRPALPSPSDQRVTPFGTPKTTNT